MGLAVQACHARHLLLFGVLVQYCSISSPEDVIMYMMWHRWCIHVIEPVGRRKCRSHAEESCNVISVPGLDDTVQPRWPLKGLWRVRAPLHTAPAATCECSIFFCASHKLQSAIWNGGSSPLETFRDLACQRRTATQEDLSEGPCTSDAARSSCNLREQV